MQSLANSNFVVEYPDKGTLDEMQVDFVADRALSFWGHMGLALRRSISADVNGCGRICFEAFNCSLLSSRKLRSEHRT